ncbi:MAG: murein biosynthesis integral membrane protein MurJ [Rhodopila sp.]
MASSADHAEPDSATALELRGLISDSRIVAVGALVSRITGFGRMAATAAVLGPTFFGNLFQSTVVLPHIVYLVVMGTLIAAILVPPLVQRSHSKAELRRFAGAVLAIMLLTLAGIGLLSALFAPLLLRALTLGVNDSAIRDQQMRLGLPLLLMVMPQVALYGIAGLGMAVQQAQRRFALAAFAPAFENLINIAALVTSALLFGAGTDVAAIQLPNLLLLGGGSTLAVIAHAAVQWYGAYRVGVPLWPRLDWRDPDVRLVLHRSVASVGYVGCDFLAFLLLLVIAGAIPGGVAAVQITHNLVKFPVAMSAIALGSAQLPRLSACIQRQDLQAFRLIYESGLRLIVFMSVPAAAMLASLPDVFAGAAAFGAMKSPAGIALIAACLGGRGVGVIGDAVFVFSTSASYARHDTSTPLHGMGVRLLLTAIGALAAQQLAEPGPRLLWWLGAALCLADLAAGYYLTRRLSASLPAIGFANSRLLRTVIVATIALLPTFCLTHWFGDVSALTSLSRVGLALSAFGITAVVYLIVSHLSGSRELGLLLPLPGGGWPLAKRTPVKL